MKLFNLISSFFSVSLLFLASDITFRFGIYGGIILCTSFFTASLLLFLFRGKLFRKKEHMNKNLFIYIVLFIYLLESVFLSCWIIISVMPFLYTYSPLAPALLLLFFCLLLALPLFITKTFELAINTSILINLFMVFMMAILVSNTIYLQKGLETVYHNLLHYHPAMLHESKEGMLGMFFVLVALFFVRQYIIFSLHSIGNKKFMSHLFLMNLCVGSVMLAFSTMVLVAITERVQSVHPNVLVIAMLQELMNSYIFPVIWGIIVLASIISLLLTWVTIKRYIGTVALSKSNFYIGLLIIITCLVVFNIIHLKSTYVVDILVFFTAWIIPFIIFLLNTNLHNACTSQLVIIIILIFFSFSIMWYTDLSQEMLILFTIVASLMFSTISRLCIGKVFHKVKKT